VPEATLDKHAVRRVGFLRACPATAPQMPIVAVAGSCSEHMAPLGPRCGGQFMEMAPALLERGRARDTLRGLAILEDQEGELDLQRAARCRRDAHDCAPERGDEERHSIAAPRLNKMGGRSCSVTFAAGNANPKPGGRLPAAPGFVVDIHAQSRDRAMISEVERASSTWPIQASRASRIERSGRFLVRRTVAYRRAC